MVFIMKYQTDGCCRGNGKAFAKAAAACVQIPRRRKYIKCLGEMLPSDPIPTNQRAELMAIILALRTAVLRAERLKIHSGLRVIIETDSSYAVGCMTKWIKKWRKNGWVTTYGRSVANRDLIDVALMYEERIRAVGKVTYKWIPRSENVDADRHCNEVLDKHMAELRMDFELIDKAFAGLGY